MMARVLQVSLVAWIWVPALSLMALCPSGEVAHVINDRGATVCIDSNSDVLGPLPQAMQEACRSNWENFCFSERWPLEKVKQYWGRERCPLGTQLGSDGLCLETLPLGFVYVYGAFKASFYQSCRKNSQAAVECRSFRFYLSNFQFYQQNMQEESPLQVVLRDIQGQAFYRQPTWQDQAGRGIYPTRDGDFRSETVYPPFVLGPRRQVDGKVRQLYQLLPAAIQNELAFAVPNRLVQNPEAYLPYLQSRQGLVLIHSFRGIGQADSEQHPKYPRAARRHQQELINLRLSIQLAQALQLPIRQIFLGMGDSNTGFGLSIRARLQRQVNQLLRDLNLDLNAPIGWGADELVAVAFAAMLPPLSVHIEMANPQARHHYDGLLTTAEIVNEKIARLGLQRQGTDDAADIQVIIWGRRPGGRGDDWQANDQTQKQFDRNWQERIATMPPRQRQRTAIVDARIFNGTWDLNSISRQHCDYLAFGAWGTFGNKLGDTLATAKILHHSQNARARQQLYLEAIANDGFVNDYESVQRGGFRDRLEATRGIAFRHYEGYQSAAQTAQVFDFLQDEVNRRMRQHFANSSCFSGETRMRIVPQLWRTFEVQSHLLPVLEPRIGLTGVFRQASSYPEIFDPTPVVTERLQLSDLIP